MKEYNKNEIMENTIKTTSHQENWDICENLKKEGFSLVANCVWAKIFKNTQTGKKISVILEY